MKKTFILEDLDCAHCAGLIEGEVQQLDQVESANLNFMTKRLVVDAPADAMADVKKQIVDIVKKREPDVTVKER